MYMCSTRKLCIMYVQGITALTVIINSTRGERGSGGEADCGGGGRKKVIKLSSRVAGLCLREHRGRLAEVRALPPLAVRRRLFINHRSAIIIRRMLKCHNFKLGVAVSIKTTI